MNDRVCIPIGDGQRAAYDPKEDITIYELAKISEIAWGIIAGMETGAARVAFDELPDEAKRHFEILSLEPVKGGSYDK